MYYVCSYLTNNEHIGKSIVYGQHAAFVGEHKVFKKIAQLEQYSKGEKKNEYNTERLSGINC